MEHSFWTGDPIPPKIGFVLENRGSWKLNPCKLYFWSLSGRFWKFKIADRSAVTIHGRHLKKEDFGLEKWRNNKNTIRIEPQTHVFWSAEHESASIFGPSPKRLSLTQKKSQNNNFNTWAWESKGWKKNFEQLLFSCILIRCTRICFYFWSVTPKRCP